MGLLSSYPPSVVVVALMIVNYLRFSSNNGVAIDLSRMGGVRSRQSSDL
jgi:hypothetical protein